MGPLPATFPRSITPPHQAKRTIILLAFQTVGQFSLNSLDNPP